MPTHTRWVHYLLITLAGPTGMITQLTGAERPNILFIIADDLGQRLGCYRDPDARTPHIDRLADQGVRFHNCFTQYPTCGPSRASLFSGLYPFENQRRRSQGTIWHATGDWVTLPKLFRQKGYITARVGKVFHMGIPRGIGQAGLDDEEAWDIAINNTGWDGREENDTLATKYGTFPGPGVAIRWHAPDIDPADMADGVGTLEALRLMRDSHPDKTGKPLMLFMGYYRPHPPMISPRVNWDAIDPMRITLPTYPADDRDDIPTINFHLPKEEFNFLPDAAARSYTHAYHAAVNFVDSEVGKLVAGLTKTGLVDNTIIVFTGDQGFHLGEHGHWHKSTFFEQACRVPLIIIDPRSKTKGQTARGLCGLVDVYPTLCEMAGIDPEYRLSGKSLVPQLENPALPGKPMELTQGTPGGASLRTERFRYTEWKKEGVRPMLYDLRNDPGEFHNLSGKPAWQETESELREKLHAMMQ